MKDEIYERLTKHLEWLGGIPGGERFNLKNIDTQNMDLSRLNLQSANMSNIDLTNVNLTEANLSFADLSNTNLMGVDLSSADLSNANLSGANFYNTILFKTILEYSNLSGAKNLLNPIDYMKNNFEYDDLGWIVYKAIGQTFFHSPKTWKIEPGSFLEEVVNPCRTNNCGCGVNFAILKWIRDNIYSRYIDIWKCRIHWMDACSIIVPYNTDGKCRCGQLELLEVIDSY